ncbi:MAG TPA: AEC family transporter [Candidatus Corynebacterium avicola]|uniref:AEC family transporter n=1 Tax=Candidatus Corynebacterium avicola TaxID=2838527 RepID=A0A9D1ULQ4_9CORY|nr:AEC family transporter [Candidatus Corynebacterium avicola]
MLDVLSGFLVVVILIALGYAVGRRKLLGTGAVYTLNMFVFFLATPALLINVLREADLAELFGQNLVVVVLSSLAAGLVGFLGYRFLARRSVPDSVITMLACSYCNGANLGIPITAHVLDDPTAALPVIIFQVAVYGPVSVLILDVNERRQKAAAKNPDAEPGAQVGLGPLLPLVRELLFGVFRNPLILAAIAGVTLAVLHQSYDIAVPHLLAEPIDLLASAAVPCALVAFGLSMAEITVLDPDSSPRRSVWMAALMKTVGHPLIAFVIAKLLFGASGAALLAFVVVAALPTAQNVFTYATRFGTNTVLARDTAVISTVLAIPSIAVIAVLLG